MQVTTPSGLAAPRPGRFDPLVALTARGASPARTGHPAAYVGAGPKLQKSASLGPQALLNPPRSPQDARFPPPSPPPAPDRDPMRLPAAPIWGMKSPILGSDQARPGHRARIGLVQQTFIRRARQAPPRPRDQCVAHDG